MTVTLDVLVPHYEDPEGLAMSLTSIAAQSWLGSMRVIVVDDGSSVAAYRSAREQLDQMSCNTLMLRNHVNKGRPYTRNRLLDQIDAPYVAWLDAGDRWYTDKIARQFDEMHRLRYRGQDTSRFWVTCDYHWWPLGRKPQQKRQFVDQDQLKALLMGGNLRAYLWTILAESQSLRRVGYFDERLPRLQDLDYFLRFVEAGGTIISTADRGPLCRYNKSDIGRNSKEIHKCMNFIFVKHRYKIEKYGSSFIRMRRHNAALHAARFAKNNRSWGHYTWLIARSAWDHPRLTVKKLLGGKLAS